MTNDSHQTILKRRDLLKLAGAGAGALLLGSAQPAVAAESTAGDSAFAMLYDATRCIGCRACEVACKEWNKLPPDPEPAQDLTAYTWTLIKQYQAGNETSFRKFQCMHCVHPACVSVCTVGALIKSEQGPVVYDAHKCIGCRYCQYGCPFGVPKFEWDQTLGLIGKCDFCAGRLADGLIPACAEACPVGALSFGTRAEMTKEAYGRLQAEPDRYNGDVYGVTEGGGTSILILAAVPFDKLGLPDLDPEPLTQGSTTVMNATPTVIALLVPVLSGIYWLTRETEVGEEES
jgi:formate dehydrogenase iron-sulfur subunit